MNTEVPSDAPVQHRFHFFISHASEDKESWAQPLTLELKVLGCEVWIDDEQMVVGDDIVAQINKGLRESKYVVAIISSNWLRKAWTNAEGSAALSSTMTNAEGGAALTSTMSEAHGRILPIRHGVTQEALANNLPLFGPLLTLSTEVSVRQVAAALVRAISQREKRASARTTPDLRKLADIAPEPDGVEALDHLREVAASKERYKARPPKATRSWRLLLFLCVAGVAVVGASLTTRFNPKLRRLTSDLADLQTTTNSWKQQSDKRATTIAELELRLKNAEDALTGVAAERDALEQKLQDANGTVSTQNKQIRDLTLELEDERNRAAASMQAAGRGWQQQADEAGRKITELELRLKETEDARAGLTADRQRLEQKLNEVNSVVETRDKKIVELSAQVGTLSDHIKTLQQENQGLTKLVGDVEGKQKLSTEELAELQKQKQNYEAHLDRAQKTMEGKVKEWNKTATENARLVRELTTTRNKVTEMERDALAKKTELSRLRREVQALEDRPTGTKLVRVYANYRDVYIADDEAATTDSENVQHSEANLPILKPPGTRAVVLLLGCCINVSADNPQEVVVVQPTPLQAQQHF